MMLGELLWEEAFTRKHKRAPDDNASRAALTDEQRTQTKKDVEAVTRWLDRVFR